MQLFWVSDLEHGLGRRAGIAPIDPVDGRKVSEGIFGIDAAFDGPTIALNCPIVCKLNFSPAAIRIIHSTKSKPVMAFGHRVFDLQVGYSSPKSKSSGPCQRQTQPFPRFDTERLWPKQRPEHPWLALVSSLIKGDGASSITFWCRRWIEHSRSFKINDMAMTRHPAT